MITDKIQRERFTIREVRCKIIKPITLTRPFYDATMGPFASYKMAILTLVDNSGFEGEIEYPISGLDILKKYLLPVILESNNTLYSDLYKAMFWLIRNEGFRGEAARALGYLDRVFYDIASRRESIPLHRYLGATRDWATVYASGGSTALTDEQLVEECLSFKKAGYSVIKMKVGGNFGAHLNQDIKRVAQVRSALGTDIRLAVDLNQALTVPQALDFIKSIEEYNIDWVEEPIHSADINGMRELTSKTEVYISYGESERTYYPFELMLDAGIKHFQPTANNMISIDEFFTVCDLATKHNLTLSCGAFPNVNAQLIATQKEEAMCEYLMPLLEPIGKYIKIQPSIKNGKAIIPIIDGISIRFDWDRIIKEDMIEDTVMWKVKTKKYL